MAKKLLLLVALSYSIWLTVVSLISLKGVPSLGSSFDDKIYHFVAYVALAFLWVTYFKSAKKRRNNLVVFFAVLLFGIVLELIQHQLNANRTYDTFDLLANCIGVIIGTLIALKLHIYKLN